MTKLIVLTALLASYFAIVATQGVSVTTYSDFECISEVGFYTSNLPCSGSKIDCTSAENGYYFTVDDCSTTAAPTKAIPTGFQYIMYTSASDCFFQTFEIAAVGPQNEAVPVMLPSGPGFVPVNITASCNSVAGLLSFSSCSSSGCYSWQDVPNDFCTIATTTVIDGFYNGKAFSCTAAPTSTPASAPLADTPLAVPADTPADSPLEAVPQSAAPIASTPQSGPTSSPTPVKKSGAATAVASIGSAALLSLLYF